ncbi:MAG: 1-acyl-sn-glycerol-3-phosphate acyltransferase [Proteobacteria bacterium]|nr:1-acyl-sn-glycerol-3-phosphate acyltransferase [Pseudomonadota bacterium]
MLLVRFLTRLIGLIILVVCILPLVLLLVIYARKTQNKKFNKKVINAWSKKLCYVCGLKLAATGKIHNNPVFIVANHVSWLDIPVIHSYKLVGFVAKAEINNWPFLGLIARCGESLFITRGQQESRKKVITGIKERLQQGRSIAVFPEGKATDGMVLGRFHRQLLHAAVEEKIPIQAITIKYLNKQGHRNKQICFKGNESFVRNVLRILSMPTSTVELTSCDVLPTHAITARKAAEITYHQVAQVLAKNDYL